MRGLLFGGVCLAGLAVALAGCGAETLPIPGPIVFSARPNDPEAYGWQLFVVGAEGRRLRRLTHTDGDGSPAWSPDGSKVAFARQTDDCELIACEQIWLVDRGGGNETRLTPVSVRSDAPAWSPDGGSVAYVQWHDSDDWSVIETAIYVMGADGADPRPLTDGGGWEVAEPAWSHDGKRIAFWRGRYDHESDQIRGDIYVVEVDGGSERRLTHTLGDQSGFGFDWSPDGKQMVVASNRNGNYDLYLIDTDGAGERQLTRTPQDESQPLWAPDGQSIAFSRVSSTDEESAIVTLELDGDAEMVLSPAGMADVAQAWSPDGEQIVFTRGSTGSERLWMMDADGTAARRVHGPYSEASLGVDWAPAPSEPTS